MKRTNADASGESAENPELQKKIDALKQNWSTLPPAEIALRVQEIEKTGYKLRRLAKQLGKDESTLRKCLKKYLPRPTQAPQPKCPNPAAAISEAPETTESSQHVPKPDVGIAGLEDQNKQQFLAGRRFASGTGGDCSCRCIATRAEEYPGLHRRCPKPCPATDAGDQADRECLGRNRAPVKKSESLIVIPALLCPAKSPKQTGVMVHPLPQTLMRLVPKRL